ncbi:MULTISPECIES: NAD(P)H-hydrate dehydratase [unclassified Polynucleobacter]|uniref:NAD(P)H-hydrate dehydratase n=1 Tax=unclassified Polynucleobacter TaxID=2640945 RepID=UPI001C0B4289|nr:MULTISPECIES: NAD(P)H-hydrate dehydratase [unclassified Polynucleobacter]MBU3638874.1 NAD(P)H-hydrate dehydratase [Polynucleobacter sp. AP-RePozz3-80-G7]MBU3640707.1 NAD(P)H-hydrate dehydratase [Polynucleobacter sp. Fuers-14]
MTIKPDTLDALKLVKFLEREASEHKGNAGKVVLIGGAPGMAGALILAGNACLHLGAGWTILEILDPASAHADFDHPELMIRLATDDIRQTLNTAQPDVIAVGPGLGKSPLAIQCLGATLSYSNIPLVIDADALNLISESTELLEKLQVRNQALPGLTVLTPHPGEAAKLLMTTTEKVQSDRVDAIQKLVELTQSIVVLKGQHTLIASSQHSPVQCLAGNAGMGTGGMGDILTGSIAAIAAQGIRHQLDLWQATGIAVELHASAADSLVSKGIGPIGLTPSETILEMRALLNKLL